MFKHPVVIALIVAAVAYWYFVMRQNKAVAKATLTGPIKPTALRDVIKSIG